MSSSRQSLVSVNISCTYAHTVASYIFWFIGFDCFDPWPSLLFYFL